MEPFDEATNKIHKAKLLKVICDQTTCHKINNGSVDKTKAQLPDPCLRNEDAEPSHKRVKFDNSIILARCELRAWRCPPTSHKNPH